jgi:branched-chain amino acid aminotransferase
MDNSQLYGKGIFTTVAIRDKTPIFFQRHWNRLVNNASGLRMDLHDFSAPLLLDILRERITYGTTAEGRARITFLDRSSNERWPSAGNDSGIHMSIILSPLSPEQKIVHLQLSPFTLNSRSPLAGMKTTNYLEHLLACEYAQEQGYSEAVRLNERGEIASACMANLFWLKGGKLFTPSLRTGCLPGTTREYILENLDCTEVEAPLSELEAAEAIFLTSAGLGVKSAASFNGKRLSGVDHPILHLLPF